MSGRWGNDLPSDNSTDFGSDYIAINLYDVHAAAGHGAAEIEQFITAFDDPRKKLLVTLLYDCGLRWHEASNLRWEHIELNQGYARIIGKGNKERLVLLSERLSRSLVALRKPEGYIFINQRTDMPWIHIKRAWATAEKKTGLKLNPHLLRHAHATFMLGATGDLRLVQTELGHADIKTTEIYTHISLDRLRVAQQKTASYNPPTFAETLISLPG